MAIFSKQYLQEFSFFKKKEKKQPPKNITQRKKRSEEEVKALRKEVQKVISICKEELKKSKEKHKNDFDFHIIFRVDRDNIDYDIEEGYNNISIGYGGLYPKNSKTEYRRNVDQDKYDIRINILMELIKNINQSLKNNSLSGKVLEDWDLNDFIIDYEVK